MKSKLLKLFRYIIDRYPFSQFVYVSQTTVSVPSTPFLEEVWAPLEYKNSEKFILQFYFMENYFFPSIHNVDMILKDFKVFWFCE